MGFSPQVVDLDGDGIDDIISGSYMPGHMFIFRGRSDGSFATGEALTGADGEKLLAGKPREGPMGYDSRSLAAVPYAADIDADGDLDLLVGNIQGEVILIENDGGTGEPAFGTKTPLKAGDRTITVPGGDSGPVVVDWDGDGVLDLVVGAGDGTVMLYRNTGTKQEPTFDIATVLIEPPVRTAGRHTLGPDDTPTRPGMRAKLCVTDYDHDGRLDLLVGDFAMQERPEPDLTDEQKERRQTLEGREGELRNQLTERMRTMMKEQGDAGLSGIRFEDDEEYMRVSRELTETTEQLEPLRAGTDYHGWVWLYIRRGDADSTASAR